MKTIRLGPHDIQYCREAARLHIRSIHHGLLPLLGYRFLAKLYLFIAAAPEAGIWALANGEQLVGFVAGCADVSRTYRWLILNHGLALALAAGPALLRRAVLAKLHSVLFYPLIREKTTAAIPAPKAELLAIAVATSEYGKGHGRNLLQAFEAALAGWGVATYRVLTNAAEMKSNAFYRATGFVPAGTMRHHTLILQVYEKTLDR